MRAPGFGLIGRTYRHVHRYQQILTILLKHGFGDLLARLHIEQYLEYGRRLIRGKAQPTPLPSTSERLRLAIEELGPTFVKVGQLLSTRPDLAPAEVVAELTKLCDSVPAFPFDEAKVIIESELSRPLAEMYCEIEEVPFAAASLGQVHRAKLRSGEEVVIKVQRPNIQTTIETDLEILLHLAELAETYLEEWRAHRPAKVIEELSRTVLNELDYTNEAKNTERFGNQFVNDTTVRVPRVYHEFSTRRVLTLEFIHGLPIAEVVARMPEGYDGPELARRGADLMLKQIFEHGFFHADPHPGNVFVLPGNVIGYVDFGMVGRLARRRREQIADLLVGVVRRDETRTVDAVLSVAQGDEISDRPALERDIAEMIEEHLHRPMRELDFGKLLRQILDIGSRYGLRIPPDLVLMLKSLSSVEATARQLDPDFDIAQRAAPFLTQLQRQRFGIRRLFGEVFDVGSQFAQLAHDLPGELRVILNQIKLGKVRVEFEHRGLEQLCHTLDQTSNRLAYSVVLASLIIASSLIILADIPPKWYDLPLIGLAGYLIAGIMGFGLLLSIRKHGKL